MKKKMLKLIAAAGIVLACGFAKADTISFALTSPTHGTSQNDFNYNSSTGLTIGSGLDGTVTSDKQLTTGPLDGLIYTDVFMVLNPTSIAPVGAATSTNVGNGLTEITQQLAVTSTFAIKTGNSGQVFDADFDSTPDPNSTLLSGTISSLLMDVTGVLGQKTGGFTGTIKANSVNYTGGEIYSMFGPNGLTNPGTFTFNLSAIGFVNGFGVNQTNQHLTSFSSNGSGEFDATVAVPAPLAAWGGMGLMGVAGAFKALRRKASSVELL